jgi:integrase
VAALREVYATRPEAADAQHDGLVFLAPDGRPWIAANQVRRGQVSRSWEDRIGHRFRRMVKRLGITGTFYDLRRTFRTVADAAGDQPACDLIMGHAHSPDDMPSVYRQTIGDDRLVRVAEHVRIWLFGTQENG